MLSNGSELAVFSPQLTFPLHSTLSMSLLSVNVGAQWPCSLHQWHEYHNLWNQCEWAHLVAHSGRIEWLDKRMNIRYPSPHSHKVHNERLVLWVWPWVHKYCQAEQERSHSRFGRWVILVGSQFVILVLLCSRWNGVNIGQSLHECKRNSNEQAWSRSKRDMTPSF